MWTLRGSALPPVFLLALLSWGRWPPPRATWQSHCDAALSPPPNDPYGYRPRGDRCEGLYAREVASGATLLLVSLTESFGGFDPTPGDYLRIEWTAPRGPGLRLRSYSLRRRLYYRMDTARPAGDTAYQWPTPLLRALGLSRADVGVIGWVSLPVGGGEREVYVPLRVRGQGAAVQPRSFQMVILPSAELAQVFVSLASVRADGSLGAHLQRDRPLAYGFYPAWRGIRIPLPAIQTPGIYLVEIGATLRAGGSSTTSFSFYHPGA